VNQHNTVLLTGEALAVALTIYENQAKAQRLVNEIAERYQSEVGAVNERAVVTHRLLVADMRRVLGFPEGVEFKLDNTYLAHGHAYLTVIGDEEDAYSGFSETGSLVQ